MKTLRDKDIEPAVLSRYIHEMLLESRPPESVPINLAGAESTAKFLTMWIGS
jgi:predicted glycosyltransferase